MSSETDIQDGFQIYDPTKIDATLDPSIDKMCKTKSYQKLERLMNPKHPINVWIHGDTGLGKSSTVLSIAKQQRRAVVMVNMSFYTDVDDIVGGLRLVNGETIMRKGPVAIAMEMGALLLLDECLDENEKVRIGTVDNWIAVPLKDLEKDVMYPIVSFNINTRKEENDDGYIISEREDELFEITLEDGRTVIANSNHPFFKNVGDTIIESSISTGLAVGDDIEAL